MMKIRIVAVGKLKEAYWREALKEYEKRISRFARLEIVELEEGKGAPKEIVRKESASISEKIEGGLYLMDLRGTPTDSAAFAKGIDLAAAKWGTLTFVIGGSHGVDDTVRARADKKIQFGLQTLLHQMMRIVLAEQIYRAFTILNGIAYHK